MPPSVTEVIAVLKLFLTITAMTSFRNKSNRKKLIRMYILNYDVN